MRGARNQPHAYQYPIQGGFSSSSDLPLGFEEKLALITGDGLMFAVGFG
jgi:hypothetical protein